MPRILLKLVLGMLVIMMLALMWRWMSSNGLLSVAAVDDLLGHLTQWRTAPWMFLAVIVVYVILLLTMFPLSLLVVITGLVFGPAWGLLFATLGTLASSVASYWAGYWLGREALLHYGGRYLHGAAGYLSQRGIWTMAIINLLPLAPFTMTNMMAGAFHLRFRDYMIGSTLGIVPGLAVVILLGSQLGALFHAAEREDILWALAGFVVAILLLLGLARFSQRFIRPSDRADGSGDIPPELPHRNRSQRAQND